MIYNFNAVEVFKMAIDIEENGRLFYERAQDRSENLEVKKIFEELGQEEVKHKARFAALMAELPASTTHSTVWDPQGELDQYLKMMADMHVFSTSENVVQLTAKLGGSEDALKLAIGFEKDSIVFFAEMQMFAETPEAKDKIGQLVKEEQGHLKKLALQLKKITK
ncbi:MAG: ferritin family protein [Deltaproteobacteria bacterium]|nr:ferritin family protein [Deltaproteobacteria bacterium]